jgi:hypothetical protein
MSTSYSTATTCISGLSPGSNRLSYLLLVVATLSLGCQTEVGGTGKSGSSGNGSFEQFCEENPEDETCVHCRENPGECQDNDGTGDDTGNGDGTGNGNGDGSGTGGGQPDSFEEYCQQNPQDEDCVYCQQNPQDEFCQDPDGTGTGGVDCQQNPQDPSCQGGGQPGSFEEYCQQNPQDQDCVYCQQNPQDQFCQDPDGTGGVDCQQNPQDPSCQGGGTEPGSFQEYCQQNPQDPDCIYCQQNPQDPFCQD